MGSVAPRQKIKGDRSLASRSVVPFTLMSLLLIEFSTRTTQTRSSRDRDGTLHQIPRLETTRSRGVLGGVAETTRG